MIRLKHDSDSRPSIRRKSGTEVRTYQAVVQNLKFLSERKSPPHAERFRRDFQTWRSLFAFVLILVHSPRDPTHDLYREFIMVGYLFRGAQVLDIGFQDV